MTSLSQILGLARTGSPGRAWALFVEEGWDRETGNPQALTLKGRLLKDQAKSSEGVERKRLFGEAAAAYVAAAKIRTDSYPLINAAALALLGGNQEHSSELAADVLDLVDGNPDEGENAYWREATRAEALLLMGRENEAEQSLAKGIAKLPNAWEDHAATIGQFALILSEQNRDSSWLDQYRPPTSVHFSGMIRLNENDQNAVDEIRCFIEQEKPGFAYGALAAGSDLLFAQAFLDHKSRCQPAAELHVVLPFPVEQFRDLSVRPFGEHWLEQFDATLEQAAAVTTLGLDDPPLALAVDISDRMAMGQVVRNAQNLQSIAKVVTVADRDESLRPQLLHWRSSGRHLITIEGQRKQTSIGEFEPEDSNKTIGTLIWICNGDVAKLKTTLGDTVQLIAHNKGHWFTAVDQQEAFSLASDVARSSNPDIKVSMLHEIMDIAKPSIETLQRAETYAKVSQAGVVTTDHIGAMALTLTDVAQSIEEIGELKTVWGSQSLWRAI